MIIVLDTNVIVSALLSPSGALAEIMARWQADEFEVATSPPLIAELEQVLNYNQVRHHLRQSPEEIAMFLKRLRTVARVVEPQNELEVVHADPDDNRVLECALAGRAAFAVSGDDHLLSLKEYEQIVILNPAGFLSILTHQPKT